MANNVEEALERLEEQEYDATIAGNIERIEDSKLVIVEKEKEMEILADEDDFTIDDAALALNDVDVVKSGSTRISQGQEYVVPKGYYTGVFKVVADGQGQDLDEKTVTPTKAQQVVTPSSGKYGLSKVTVNAIPAAYQDVTSVTAAAGDVLVGKKIVSSTGEVIDGSMPNNTASTYTLDVTTGKQSYTIAAGYHSGNGKVQIVLEEKSATPTESAQTITPTNGKVLSKVTVAAINKAQYLTNWTADATANASDILTSKTAYVNGVKVNGSMVNNGAVTKTLTTADLNKSYTVPQGYHNGEGIVQIVPEDKSITAAQIEGKQQIVVEATDGKVLRKVTIAALPSSWYDVTGTDATAADVLASKKFLNASGVLTTGTIATVTSYSKDASEVIMNSGADGCTVDSFNEAFYKNGGSVSMDGSLFERLAAI